MFFLSSCLYPVTEHVDILPRYDSRSSESETLPSASLDLPHTDPSSAGIPDQQGGQC